MVQITDMSDLAQKSWAISCATENDWMCKHECQSKLGFMNAMKLQEARHDAFGRLRFEELVDDRALLCHIGISDRRGQGPDGKFAPVPFNAVRSQC